MNYKVLLTVLASMIFALSLNAQCENWNKLPNKESLEEIHSVYRSDLKSNNFDAAVENWEAVYAVAPVADGLRDFHFTDGIKIYKNKLGSAAEAEKQTLKENILKLYDECASCYEAQKIKLAKCGDDQDCYNKRIGYLMGRKGYDMYYELNSPYSENLEAFQKSVDMSGNDIEYIVLTPYAAITVYQFQKGIITKEQVREVHSNLNDIADYNIANNERFTEQFQQSKDAMNGEFLKVEKDIFDCDYFKAKHEPEYRDNQTPEAAKDLYGLLKLRGCDASDPLMAELQAKWSAYASQVNAQKQAEFEANNPALLASKAYKAKQFPEAIAKYREAISQETDQSKKGSYHFSIASILFRKMKKYGEARTEAKTAASLRSDWGRPYMLIGDMYATTARSCGDSWNQRLAVLAATEKYRKAKSIDPTVEGEASDKISKYRGSLPNKEEGFLRGVEAGSSARVGCWIGETVTVRY